MRQSSAFASSPGGWNYPTRPLRPWSRLPVIAPLPPAPPRYDNPRLSFLARAIVAARNAGQEAEAELLAYERFCLLRDVATLGPLPTRLLGGLVLDWQTRRATVGRRSAFTPGTLLQLRLLFRVAEGRGRTVDYATLLRDVYWLDAGPRPTTFETFKLRMLLRRVKDSIEQAGGNRHCLEVHHGVGLRVVPELT